MTQRLRETTLILFMSVISHNAFAQVNGEIRYNSNVVSYYNTLLGWSTMDAGNTAVSCTSNTPGEIRFNTSPDPDQMEFCNATTWRQMNYNVTTLTCSKSGEIDYNVGHNVIRYCNGANWVETGEGYGPVSVYLTSGTSWTVPAGWNDTNNTVEVIGGGGGGASQGNFNQAAGGGGGAYSKITNLNLTPGNSVLYVIGSGGNAATLNFDLAASGGFTYFNGASYAAASVAARGGGGANGSTPGAGGLDIMGSGTTRYSGGMGGDTSNSSWGGAGGGGSGGPNGAGGAGGNETAAGNDNETAGTGGGGGGGGANGTPIPGNTHNGSAGGNNSLGAGGGAGGTSPSAGTPGSAGGGGGGGGGINSVGVLAGAGASGGAGTEWDSLYGSGGGGGGGGSTSWSQSGAWGGVGGNGGLYGAGGGGGGTTKGGTNSLGGNGAKGIIRVTYTPPLPPTFVQEAELAAWNTSATPRSTSSFNIQTGDVLVAYVIAENQGDDFTIANTNGNLSWNLTEVDVGSYTEVNVWTATADANKSIQVTFTRTGGTGVQWGGNVLTFRGSSGIGTPVKTNTSGGGGTPTLNITTAQAKSAIVVVNGDWVPVDAGPAPHAWRTGPGSFVETSYGYVAGTYTHYGGYYPNAGPAGTYAVGLTAPGGQAYSIVAVEVKGQ